MKQTSRTLDPGGYTNIEIYLNSLVRYPPAIKPIRGAPGLHAYLIII